MKKVLFTFLFLLIQQSICAQVGGERIFQFLNLSTSARQVALGGEALTIMDDVNQGTWNPAAINVDMDNQLSVNYTSYLSGINLGSASFAKIVTRRFGVIHGNITYVNYGTFIGADELGNETGTFSANDIAVSVGYAFNIPRSNFYLGANARFITSNISSFTSTAIATDLALQYYSPYKPYAFALVVRNLGTQISTYTGTYEKLPLKIALGGSYQLEYVPLKWYVTIDNLQQWNLAVPNPSNQTTNLQGTVTDENINFLTNAFRHMVVGAELFPESVINLRVGYNFRRAAELKLQNVRTFGGISFGFGIKMNRFKLNYAFSKYHSATDVGTFSLHIDLDR
ncbi:MAG: penicillin-binding protein [Flavobacteriaceae bacterium]|nr:penicillin-binding protein [Flavobacteriaceae bacterium]|tara:strand:- start:9201 stop:10220 length:1020 start_codon:yes stop_codon:yes gene_type:complete